jgi:hypothetical protein
MARRRVHLITCSRCKQRKEEDEFNCPVQLDPGGERTGVCFDCNRETLKRYLNLKSEMVALERQGVHPRLIERIAQVRIDRGELTGNPKRAVAKPRR